MDRCLKPTPYLIRSSMATMTRTRLPDEKGNPALVLQRPGAGEAKTAP